MNRTLATCVLLGFASLMAIANPYAQGSPDPWYGLQANSKSIDQPKVFTGAFQIALPKNWHLAPGYTGTIFSIVEDTKKWQTGGVITLEHQRLLAPLEPAMMTTAGERFFKDVQDREGSGKRFTIGVRTRALGQLLLI